MRLLAALVGLVAVVASAISFSTASAEDVASLTVETFTDKSNYALGDPVSVTVVVTNEGTESIVLWFSSSMQAYYRVLASDGVQVYDYRAHSIALTAFFDLSLDPGESAVYLFEDSEAWPQVDDGDKSVPPGDYTILGCLDPSGTTESLVDGTEVTLGDEGDVVVDVFVEVVLEKSEYDPGEPVNVTVVVTNSGIYDRRIWYSSNLIAYYTVEDSQGVTVFDLRSHLDIYSTNTYVRSLSPGGSCYYEFDGADAWGQVDDDGQSVTAGESYTIRGYLNTTSPCEDGMATVVTIAEDDAEARFLSTPLVLTVIIVVAAACILTVTAVALLRRRGKAGEP